MIASDLPTHRESGGRHVTYLSPIDGLGWLAAIRAHASGVTDGSFRAAAESYQPRTWKDYFKEVEPFVVSL